MPKPPKRKHVPPVPPTKPKNKSNHSGNKNFMRVPMLPVPAAITRPLFLAHSSPPSSYLLPLSPSSTNIQPGSANADNTTSTRNTGRELAGNERATSSSGSGGNETIDGNRMSSDISKRTDIFYRQPEHQHQQQQPEKVASSPATAFTPTITRKGLNWTELVIEEGESRTARAKSAKEKEDGGRRRDNRSGRRRRIPFETYCITSTTKANTSQPSNQSRSILVSGNSIGNTSSPANVSTALSPTTATIIGRMPKSTTTTSTISAQSVPAPAGFGFDFTFSSPSINTGGDGIHRHHHNSKLAKRKLLFLRSPPSEQRQSNHQKEKEEQSRSSRQTQHQRHHHHYHYRDALIENPEDSVTTTVLPPTSSSTTAAVSTSTHDDNDNENDEDDNDDDDSDYGDDDPTGITNFPMSFHHARGNVLGNMKGNKRYNKNNHNDYSNGNKNKRNKIVQALNSNQPIDHHYPESPSLTASVVTKKGRKKRRHLAIPYHPMFQNRNLL